MTRPFGTQSPSSVGLDDEPLASLFELVPQIVVEQNSGDACKEFERRKTAQPARRAGYRRHGHFTSPTQRVTLSQSRLSVEVDGASHTARRTKTLGATVTVRRDTASCASPPNRSFTR